MANLRIGKRDLQLRYILRGDQTDWKNVPMIKIPDSISKPEFSLMKVQPTGNKEVGNQPIEKANMIKQTNRANSENNSDMSGTITGELQSNHEKNYGNKRKASPGMENQKHKNTPDLEKQTTNTYCKQMGSVSRPN